MIEAVQRSKRTARMWPLEREFYQSMVEGLQLEQLYAFAEFVIDDTNTATALMGPEERKNIGDPWAKIGLVITSNPRFAASLLEDERLRELAKPDPTGEMMVFCLPLNAFEHFFGNAFQRRGRVIALLVGDGDKGSEPSTIVSIDSGTTAKPAPFPIMRTKRTPLRVVH